MQTQDTNICLASADIGYQTLDQISATTFSQTHFLENYHRKGIPVVIKRLGNVDPPWNLDYLCSQIGSYYFPLRCYGRDRYQQSKRTWTTIGSGVPLQSRSFSEFAQMIRSGEAYENDIYIGRCALSQTPLAKVDIQLAYITTQWIAFLCNYMGKSM
jgi:lysine-specific demethylase 8/hypoxia-inducible factor 1-alpha inhibitor (HIF hydroxylase)